MGSAPASLKVKLPRSGVVPRNCAIVLEGRVFGELKVTASGSGGDIDVVLDNSFPLGGGGHFYWLVRPASGEWPTGLLRSTIKLRAEADAPNETFTVPIGDRDDAAPVFSWLAPPEEGVALTPWEHRRFLQFEYGPVEDDAGPFVSCDVEFVDGSRRTLVVEVGRGSTWWPERDTCRHVEAITLTDLAGNSCRVENPYLRAIPARPLPDLTDYAKGSFNCLNGTLEAVNTLGAFIATSDRATTNGYSRGHFESIRQEYGSNLDISVKARRLTDDRTHPIEIAFLGGFFGVAAGHWFLYEHEGHQTGWKPLENQRQHAPMLELRVVQRGKRIEGYVNGHAVGSFELEKAPTGNPVGIAFKGRPNEASRIRFHDFFIENAPLDPP